MGKQAGELLQDRIKASSPEELKQLCQELLLENLLRKHLGFNGMVVTDSNNMLGLLTYMPRKKAVPAMLAAGCDKSVRCGPGRYLIYVIESASFSPAALRVGCRPMLS